jgi:hypothetical protein
MSLCVVRTFMRMREVLATHKEPALMRWKSKRRCWLSSMMRSRAIRAQFKQVMDTLRELMAQPEPPPEPKRRPIGFVYPKEK